MFLVGKFYKCQCCSDWHTLSIVDSKNTQKGMIVTPCKVVYVLDWYDTNLVRNILRLRKYSSSKNKLNPYKIHGTTHLSDGWVKFDVDDLSSDCIFRLK